MSFSTYWHSWHAVFVPCTHVRAHTHSHRALVEATEAGIIITEVRVELTEAGEVDISG